MQNQAVNGDRTGVGFRAPARIDLDGAAGRPQRGQHPAVFQPLGQRIGVGRSNARDQLPLVVIERLAKRAGVALA